MYMQCTFVCKIGRGGGGRHSTLPVL